MHYLLLSISYKNTDIAVREKLAFDADKQVQIMTELRSGGNIDECALLVTCNRVELMLCARDVHRALSESIDVLHNASGIDRKELEGRAHSHDDEGAARHIFSVASGLESVVIGEAQIAGQFKEAFKFAIDRGFVSKRLNALANHAMRCAAAVRSSTEVGKNPISVSSAAVVQAKELMGGSLEGKTAVVVGSGEMSRLAVLHLLGDRANVIVVGRDLAKTQEFAAEINSNIEVETFSRLIHLINAHPLLFTATGAPHTVITAEMVERRDFERFWFDIAVPRDIDWIDDLAIKIYTVDDLQGIVKTNMSLREEEASKAFRIVGEYVEDFFGWLSSLGSEPVIKALRKKAGEACRVELEKVMKKGFIPQENEENARLLLHNAFKRFLHQPTIALRAAMDDQNSSETLEAVKNIFDLEGI
ncbi:MAG: glutamyl-tRNA reductase [Helicobacteraceae bacterium]|jgi:glutamyl-tRNA reductase|nr:glutamyl-tRNA reductase [Helicobacteraceae bacterium]